MLAAATDKNENDSMKLAHTREPLPKADDGGFEPQSPTPQMDGASDGKGSSVQYNMFSRQKASSTQSNSSAGSSRAQSPVSFGYLYRQNMHGGGIFGETQAPQAILS